LIDATSMTIGDREAPDLPRALQAVLRDVPDFPKPGIVFKDITPILADAALFARTTRAMAEPFTAQGVTHVAAVESRGFLFGAPIAQHLGAGVLPLRKPGKLPWRTRRIDYALEYGTDALEAHEDACGAAARVLLVDDVLATGGTADAAARLLESLGGKVVGCSFLLALDSLGGAHLLAARTVHTLLRL
jgi:adenine phosphoribosyltransferase